MTDSQCTSKQIGDACEMLVAAEITLKGCIPAMKCPDNWPSYDVIAKRDVGQLETISVKSRTYKAGGSDFVSYNVVDEFHWLAIVLLPGIGQDGRRIFLVPKSVADKSARSYSQDSKIPDLREFRLDEVAKRLGRFENNFGLLADPGDTVIATATT